MRRLFAFLCCLFWFGPSVAEPVDDLRAALAIGGDVASVAAAAEFCDVVRRREAGTPVLPVSENRDDYLQCLIDAGNRHGFPQGEIGFAFADGALALVEVRGSDLLRALWDLAPPAGQPIPYARWTVHPEDAWVISTNGDAAWLLAPDSLHPHLFLFENPLLDYSTGSRPSAGESLAIPEFLKPGTERSEVERQLRAGCGYLETVEIVPPNLPTGPQQQSQINCFGWPFGGASRKIEAVFGDESLELVWILTAAQEHDRLAERLSRDLGAPVGDVPHYVIWPDGVALRRDKPEVAIASDAVAKALFQ